LKKVVWCQHVNCALFFTNDVSTMTQKVFQVEFSCSKKVNKVGKLFHFMLSSSFVSLQQKARMTMFRLFFLLAFVFFLGSSVTQQNKSSNRVITKLNFSWLYTVICSHVLYSNDLPCYFFISKIYLEYH